MFQMTHKKKIFHYPKCRKNISASAGLPFIDVPVIQVPIIAHLFLL